MQVSQVDFSAIAFSPFVATKGVKTSQATLNGAPVEFLLSDNEWYPAPFGASAFNDDKATRLTLELDISKSPVLEVLGLAEAAIIKKAHGMGIFENQSLDDVTKTFKSSVSFSEKYSFGVPNLILWELSPAVFSLLPIRSKYHTTTLT